MRAKVFGSIETLSREISVPMRLGPLGEGDFSTLWRLCIESPSQPKLASSLHNKRLSNWRLTGFGRNDNEAGGVFVSICSLQTYDKTSAAKLSNYPVRNQSFFHSPCPIGQHRSVNFLRKAPRLYPLSSIVYLLSSIFYPLPSTFSPSFSSSGFQPPPRALKRATMSVSSFPLDRV